MSQVSHVAPVTTERQSGGPLLTGGDPAIRTDAIYVVYTSIEPTLAAARAAGGFAKALGVPVTLVHFRTVPFVLPVDEPCGGSSVETDAFITRLSTAGVDTQVRVYLCRDKRRAIPLAFKPHSLIAIAGRRRWWPTESERWRRTLEAAGHFVVLIDGPRE